MSERWWCVKGDVLWSNDAWAVRFLWDDGNLWGLNIGEAGSQDEKPNLHWDYEAQSIANGIPVGLKDGERAALRNALVVSSHRPQLIGVSANILNDLAYALLEEDGTRTGKWLRQRVQAKAGVVDQTLTFLNPRYVSRFDAVDDERFQITLAGLLQSRLKEDTIQVVELALSAIAADYARDPNVKRFSLQPILADLKGDRGLTFAVNTLRAIGWLGTTTKTDDVWMFDVPKDVEQIQACRRFAEYLDYLREQELRPWPTCPRASGVTLSAPKPDLFSLLSGSGAAKAVEGKTVRRWAEWEEVRPLGSGGQGLTYLVRAPGRDDAVLKELKKPGEKQLARFENEAKALARLKHPGILEVVDDGLEHDPPFLVTRFCAGGNLMDAKADTWPLAERLALFRSIARAVGAAHVANIVHRDLKAENILLKDDGRTPVIADFGICYMMGDSDDRWTSVDERVGARSCIPPELETGRLSDVNAACDTYGLGKVLYWLCSGRDLPREQHRHPNLDLTKGGQSVEMNLIYDLLDRLVVAEPSARIQDANLLSIEVEKLMEKIEARAHVLDRSVRQHCSYCAEGAYRVWTDHEMSEETRSARVAELGTVLRGDRPWMVLVCERCGHVQYFRPDIAKGGNAWK